MSKDKQFDSTQSLWPFLKRLFGLTKRNYPSFFWGLLAAVSVVAVADAFFPYLWMQFIDDLITPTFLQWKEARELGEVFEIKWQIFIPFIIKYVAWIATMGLGVLVFIWCAENIRERIIYDLRKSMFDKLQHLSFSFYDKSSAGWLVSRITSDTDRVTELISWGFVSFVWGISMVVICFGIMFFIEWKLALLILLTFPFMMYVSVKIRLLVLKYSRKARKQNSDMIAYVTEHINGVAVNKTTAQEINAGKGYAEKTDNMRRYSFKSAYYTAMYMPLVLLTGSVAAAFVIIYGGNVTIETGLIGGFTLGAWAAFFGYSRFIFEPIFDISRFYAMAQDSLSAGERIFSLIDEKVTIKDAENATDFGKIKGEIEFKNLHFYYNPDKQILNNFSLKIEAGKSIALVGPTGHGKTTLTALVSRFYEPTAGQVLIDGEDYTKKTLHSLRNQLGVILQQPHLFSGTLLQNILYGVDEKNEAKAIATLKMLGADALLEKLNEEVGEEGKNLSNGERQLVSFARAAIKEPAILIMDEATSSIDTISEVQIQKGIEQLIKNRTSIVIAHRLSTIRYCDTIVVIENGEIKEQGNHTTLIKQKGHYYDLYMKQARAMVVE